MPIDNVTASTSPANRRAPAPQAGDPVSIQVEGLKKAFRIPTQRVDSFKERLVHPFAARDFRELKALNGISFEVRQGEFFGIVGRNGSGKSTLLKILASIYRADAGTIRIAGRLAPFIELGVGFNQELTARENVLLNGVMMGLTPKEVRDRQDAVIDFAELHDFADLKIKNYSSGMLVRLAFSVMLQADADVLLIDEVLAVGDAAFQQKCADAFHQMKAEGKTIVLVTHEMSSVEEYCHRAMLINDGKIRHIGDPGEVGRHYLQLNFETGSPEDHAHVKEQPGDEVKLLDIWLEDEAGERTTNVEHGARFHLCAELEALSPLEGMGVSFAVANADGIAVTDFGTPPFLDGELQPFEPGQRVTVRIDIENLLMAGRYFVHLGVTRGLGQGVALYLNSALDFAVFGGRPTSSMITLPHEIEADVDAADRHGS